MEEGRNEVVFCILIRSSLDLDRISAEKSSCIARIFYRLPFFASTDKEAAAGT